MSINRALAAVYGDQDKGRAVATRTGKIVHRVAQVYLEQGKVETSCHKFLSVIVLADVTLADKKGKWGLLLGTGTTPTCHACELARQAETAKQAEEISPREAQEDIALDNIDAVPATEQGHAKLREHFGEKDPQTVKVGDLVYGYSRGKYRRGIVVKVTPTKVKMFYTTDGAVTEAKRIYDVYVALDPEQKAKFAAHNAAENWAYYTANVARLQGRIDRGEALDAWELTILKSDRRPISEETREEYVARKTTEARDAAQARKDVNKSYRQYVTYTSKDIKKSELYLV